MKKILACLLALPLTLAACGAQTADTASIPPAEPARPPRPPRKLPPRRQPLRADCAAQRRII